MHKRSHRSANPTRGSSAISGGLVHSASSTYSNPLSGLVQSPSRLKSPCPWKWPTTKEKATMACISICRGNHLKASGLPGLEPGSLEVIAVSCTFSTRIRTNAAGRYLNTRKNGSLSSAS
jgi:hypothetical protein